MNKILRIYGVANKLPCSKLRGIQGTALRSGANLCGSAQSADPRSRVNEEVNAKQSFE